MHRGTPSPIFDVPEFPTLRRVKPLPKRRRTTAGTGKGGGGVMSLSSALGVDAKPFFEHLAQQGFTITGAAATAEELIGEGDELVGSISLEDYYMPPNIQNFLAANGVDTGPPGSRSNRNVAAVAAAAAITAVTNSGRAGQLPQHLSDLNSLDFGVHFAAAAAAAAAAGVTMGGLGSLGLGLPPGMDIGNVGMRMTNTGNGGTADKGVNGGGNTTGRSRDEDDGRGDGDMDHLRQPGNTKKRKVPANMSPRGPGTEGGGGGGARPGSPSSGYADDDGADPSLEGEGRSMTDDDELQLQFQRERERDRDRDRERDRDRDRERSFSPTNRSSSHSSSSGQTHHHQYPPAPFPGQLSMVVKKRGKLMAVTLAGLQHKELLKSRKRQLAAVMGALSHGDTLALDQALTGANYGYHGYSRSGISKGSLTAGTPGGGGNEDQQSQAGYNVRKSKRRTVRLARAMKIVLAMPERRIRHPDAVPFPQADFRFSCPSGTADRLIATKEEVANLRKRFEVELEKQAAKAAKMAVAAAAAAATGHSRGASGGDGTGKAVKATGGKGKRERQERDRERAERAQAQIQAQAQMKGKDENASPARVSTVTTTTTASHASGNASGDFSPSIPGAIPGGGGKSKGKKKKRSTLANASNPHHLKNYVPSRLPHSGDGGNAGAMGAYGGVSPLPIRFLTSEIPPRRKRGQGKKDRGLAEGGTAFRATPTSQGVPGHGNQNASLIPLKNPGEEWICAFCEYDLFYGGEAAYRRAVRNRKKILRRRRRARERAARAANGKTGVTAHQPAAPPPSKDGEDEDDGYDEEEDIVGTQGTGNGQGLGAGRWKGGRGPDG